VDYREFIRCAGVRDPAQARPVDVRGGAAWTSTGTPFEPHGLKHRPGGTIRVVPPLLGGMLRKHLRAFGTAPDGRLFRGARGGMLSESVYGRAWHAARQAALSPGLAATALARRPYDLRHAALSLWLNASGAPAEVAARAGTARGGDSAGGDAGCHARGEDELPRRRCRDGRHRP
jgi:integrase